MIETGTTTETTNGVLAVPDDIELFDINGTYVVQTDTYYVLTEP